jgi:dienelactone hydrolase
VILFNAKSMGWLAATWMTASLASPATADEPFRVLSPTGTDPYPAVLLVPGCSGFVGNNGINVYDERGAELQAAGFLVIYVDYVGKRMQGNCAHVGQSEVSGDILEAAKWAGRQTRVDPGKISVVGWSYGAGGVLAALKAAPLGSPIAKAVMYYSLSAVVLGHGRPTSPG